MTPHPLRTDLFNALKQVSWELRDVEMITLTPRLAIRQLDSSQGRRSES
jgi:hypothetical protein